MVIELRLKTNVGRTKLHPSNKKLKEWRRPNPIKQGKWRKPNIVKQNNEEDLIPANIEKPKANRRPFQEPYAEVCTLEDTDEIALFNKRNYKVGTIIGLISFRMRPVNFISYTNAGSNLPREEMVEPEWISAICVKENPRLRSATNRKVEVFGTTTFHVSMGETPYAFCSESSRA